ncbi:Uncharacterised protein [uncultured archaeon]|nr:Uncharacterised protein [uncultured archaeon]
MEKMKSKKNTRMKDIIQFVIILIFLILGARFNTPREILIFLGIVTALTFFPVLLNFKNKYESDIFYYQYYTPIALTFMASILFLIISYPKEENIPSVYYISLFLFLLIYIIIHLWIRYRYPEYYFQKKR